jgi:Arc/MetJ-type ribon-helix-helix transcriptional regulator
MGYKGQIHIGLSEERREEIDETVEEGNWKNRSEYIRHIIRVGESDIAALDPRTSSESNTKTSEEEESVSAAISTEELLTALREQCNQSDKEFVPVDEAIQPFIDDLDGALTDRLLDLGTSEGTGVKTDGRGGYKVTTDR